MKYCLNCFALIAWFETIYGCLIKIVNLEEHWTNDKNIRNYLGEFYNKWRPKCVVDFLKWKKKIIHVTECMPRGRRGALIAFKKLSMD